MISVLQCKEKPPLNVVGDVSGRIAIIVVSRDTCIIIYQSVDNIDQLSPFNWCVSKYIILMVNAVNCFYYSSINYVSFHYDIGPSRSISDLLLVQKFYM